MIAGGRRVGRRGRIDRSRRLLFEWDGARMIGHPGDTLASALMANGVRLVGRSFKYHRPRGIMSAGQEEGGALVTVGVGARRTPNVKATALELEEGLTAAPQNCWPSLRRDVGEVNSLLSRFLAAGFYYKTFMGIGSGTAEWMFFERFIRRAAGLGSATTEHDPDWYEHVHGHCDVLVVGSGPAGLAAAREAAAAGLDVVLAEQDFMPGGDLLTGGALGEDDALAWRDAALADLAQAGVRMMTRTMCFGLYDHTVAGLVERVRGEGPDAPRERMHVLRCRHVIVAAGAIERPFVFGDNDRPGVMLADAARVYLDRFGVAPGGRTTVATTNDSGYRAALALAGAGVETTLLDSRDAPPAALLSAARSAGVRVLPGRVPVRAEGRLLRGVVYGPNLGGGRSRAEDRIACDCLAVSGGWSPTLHLTSHARARPTWSAGDLCFLPGPACDAVSAAGAAAGVWDRAACAASGAAAGREAARALTGRPVAVLPAPPPGGWEGAPDPVWEVRVTRGKLKGFVDPQHDVTADDIRLAHREGFVSVEHMKRYTTLGMATDQGKIGNVVGLALMAEARGLTPPEVGTTTFRPPYAPISIGAVGGGEVGAHFRPERRTPFHDLLAERGAAFTDAGLWKRAWHFPRPDEDLTAASMREARMVRETAGICDVSTLGKIMVQGPDAAVFLDRIYVNAFLKLPVGRARYGVMLREDGFVFDDGTVWRLGETDFLVTTTTARAGPVAEHLDRWLQTRWPDLRVVLTSVSDAWAGLSVAGPRARAVLRRVTGADVSDAALPFMGVARIDAAGVPCLLARISFSGELAYEIWCAPDDARTLLEALESAVEAEGGGHYGLEALDILRVEKGHVTGREIDGRTTLGDLGFARMAKTSRPFVGSALMRRPAMIDPQRPALVGLTPVDPTDAVRAGAILTAPDGPRRTRGVPGIGHVSSVADSPQAGMRIALGFAAGGLAAWEGRELVAADPTSGFDIPMRVVAPHFFDPEGARLHG